MAYNWNAFDTKVDERVRELVTKAIGAYPALSQPLEFVRTRESEHGYPVTRIYVVGEMHETKRIWLMTFVVRNLMVSPLMGVQGSSIPLEEDIRTAKSRVPGVPFHAWQPWDRQRKIAMSGHFQNRPR